MTTPGESDLSINRRTLLKASGATAMGLTAVSGVTSASPPREIRFCGCSQVCVDIDSSYRILYATETTNGYTCSLDPSITESEPRTSMCFTVDPGEKIIGVLDGQRTLYWNPNNCAQRAIAAIGDPNDCAGCTANDGTAGDCFRMMVMPTQVSKHEYDANGVTVRTRLCKPPSRWKDDPNGPPSDAGPPNDTDSSERGGPPSGSRGRSSLLDKLTNM